MTKQDYVERAKEIVGDCIEANACLEEFVALLDEVHADFKEQKWKADKCALALMMIQAGAKDPREFASRVLNEVTSKDKQDG